MKNKLLYLLTILTFCIGFSSAFLVSDQGTDVRDVSTGNLTALANLTISIYDSPTGGNLIFEQTFEGGIVNGSWNVMINPNLEYGRSYWKDYKINNEDLDFDGNERLEFQSAVGPINNITFVNFSLINSCPAGSSIRVIYENGSVLCEIDDLGSGSVDLTNYALKNQSETFEGNITTSHTGFFGWLGSLISRIGKLFVQDIEFNGTITGSGDIITSGNVTADYFIGDGSHLTGISGDTYDDSWINNSIDDKIFTNNESVTNYILWVNSTNTQVLPPETDPYWRLNYTNMQNPCTPNFVTGIHPNGTFICGTVQQAAETDPYWTSNYTAFNQSWSSTTNLSYATWAALNNGSYLNVPETDPYWNANYSIFLTHATTSYVDAQNTSQTNYIASVNTSMKNYVDDQIVSGGYNDDWINQTIYNTTQVNAINTSMKNYVDSTFTTENYVNLQNTSQTNLINLNNQSVTNYINSVASIGEPNWNANFTAFNASWSSTTNLSYATWAALNNGSYLNVPETDSLAYNGTLVSIGILNNGSYFNTPETDPYWRLNYTNMQNPCTPNFVTGIHPNGTFICGTVQQAAETDPYWTSNYTAFNQSWSTTTNLSYATW
ncbi:MAG TPA: hypothetical protein PKW70_03795, partial [Candidatus Pacearchaeota archaeon]|nr:hypothetical protein [Candidatus Pacearchaeota archaeon]